MMYSISNQTYIGRVVGPAVARQFPKSGKDYITFTLLVNGVVKKKDQTEKKTEPLRISCSYVPYGDNDPVPLILCNIASKDFPELCLAGQTYKSVEVLVEGAPKFGEVVDYSNNVIQSAIYLGLTDCKVRILDKKLLDLWAKETGTQTPFNKSTAAAPITPTAASEESKSAAEVDEDLPLRVPTPSVPTAPQAKYVAGSQAPTAALPRPATAIAIPLGRGSKIKQPDGTICEFIGNDPANPGHWRKVEPAPAKAEVQSSNSQTIETTRPTAQAKVDSSPYNGAAVTTPPVAPLGSLKGVFNDPLSEEEEPSSK